MITSTEIHLRDPFVLPVPSEQRYYLYGTHGSNGQARPVKGFDCFTSADLEHWDGPIPVFRPPLDFWADRNFWAPEVHRYQGRYYLFASFKAPGVCRGTQVLAADNPSGPFLPHSEGPLTPCDWESLDGTLFIDRQGDPWLVFCHEWVQTVDGEVCAARLSPDLHKVTSTPVLLFRASAVPWVRALTAGYEGGTRTGYVTDGPFLYHANGDLRMLWSSYSQDGYTLASARSASGQVPGPWIHDPQPLYHQDCGHAMLFTTFAGQRMLAMHQPNRWPNERPVFLKFEE